MGKNTKGMKKVLIVTYYWPPAGGSGIQRVLKFSKFLPRFGWKPIILTVNKGVYPDTDESLRQEVPEKAKVFRSLNPEKYIIDIYKKFNKMSKDENIQQAVLSEKDPNWRKKISNWFRLNFFIPDAKIPWFPFAYFRGLKIIKKTKPDIIFSSAPPPTVHLIASNLSRICRLKWIADFRDPWTDIHYYKNKKRIKLTEKLDKKMERWVLKSANKITCTSQMDIEQDFSQKVSKSKFFYIPNGYDGEDFDEIDESESGEENKFLLIHSGSIYEERLPINLFKSIKRLDEEDKISKYDFALKLIGKKPSCVEESTEKYNIEKYVECTGYLEHKEALSETKKASLLLLLINQTENNIRILPGKTFEYLNMRKPILGLGPEDGEVSRIINEKNAGEVIEYENEDKIYNFLLEYYNKWKNNSSDKNLNFDISEYSRKNLTKKLVDIFEKI